MIGTCTKLTERADQADLLGVSVRWMISRDLPKVLAIEEACFHVPWDEADFLRALRQKGVIGKVAECGDEIVGFMVYGYNPGKPPTRFQILNLAVKRLWRGHGIGALLMAHVLRPVPVRLLITCDVGDWNTATHLWLRATGFKAIQILRGHYDDPRLPGTDAYRFRLVVPPTAGAAP